MRSRKPGKEPRLPFELRALWWLLKLVWRLPLVLLVLLGSVVWLIAWPFRRRPRPQVEWPTADEFYRSYGWRSLRIATLEANRKRHGGLRCECCLAGTTGRWHVDHIHPRSSHPELALEPANLQVLCEDCNLGKGDRYTTDWRCDELT